MVLTISSGKAPEPKDVSVTISVVLPQNADALDFTVWVDGIQDAAQSVRVDPKLTKDISVKLTNKADKKSTVVIRLNGKDYQSWEVDYSNASATLTKNYGYEVPSNPDTPDTKPDTPEKPDDSKDDDKQDKKD